MLNLILFGPPGSGKGTQSEKIIGKFGLIHLSTGDLLRSEIADKSPLGGMAKNFIDQGILVPDEVVIAMIAFRLDGDPDAGGFIFDGFPRTAAQAEALDGMLEDRNEEISIVLFLSVPESELIRRLLHRGTVSQRTDDASESVIRARIREYHDKTAPVADHYSRLGKFRTVQGDGSVEETFRLLCQEISLLV
ncbi:MAG TPA: adenylate kinase [Chitinophagaceae bacterium]|nr:adenylate kinase [Chitinophagaceae bacterium]